MFVAVSDGITLSDRFSYFTILFIMGLTNADAIMIVFYVIIMVSSYNVTM